VTVSSRAARPGTSVSQSGFNSPNHLFALAHIRTRRNRFNRPSIGLQLAQPHLRACTHHHTPMRTERSFQLAEPPCHAHAHERAQRICSNWFSIESRLAEPQTAFSRAHTRTHDMFVSIGSRCGFQLVAISFEFAESPFERTHTYARERIVSTSFQFVSNADSNRSQCVFN